MAESLSEMEVNKRQAIRDYVMPHVFQGQIVLYYGGKGAKPDLAFATEVSEGHLVLAILPVLQMNFSVKRCVRHRSDPGMGRGDETGFWDYSEQDLPRLEEFKKKAIDAKIARLEAEAERQKREVRPKPIVETAKAMSRQTA